MAQEILSCILSEKYEILSTGACSVFEKYYSQNYSYDLSGTGSCPEWPKNNNITRNKTW